MIRKNRRHLYLNRDKGLHSYQLSSLAIKLVTKSLVINNYNLPICVLFKDRKDDLRVAIYSYSYIVVWIC